MSPPIPNKAIRQYLDRYAEGTSLVRGHPPLVFRSALVVPMFDESPSAALAWLDSLKATRSPDLLVLVVNETASASLRCRRANQALLHQVRAQCSDAAYDENGVAFHSVPAAHFDARVVVIDRTGPARCFGPREGVGRARKMGFDLALGLYARGQLLQPWVGSGDGDGVWTAEQWQTLTEEDQSSSAWLYPYRHRPTSLSSLDDAMTEVELGYRFYVLGLAYARSPYAYHALGSAMAVRLDAYAQVRGVPNLQAGEDFYLLNKLAKLRPLKRRKGSPIELTTRVSHRVPFGTGQALASLLQAKETRKTFSSLTFDPRVFEGLRLFLLHLTGQSPLESGSTAPPLTKVRLEPLVEKAVRDSAAELLASMQGELATAPSNAHRLRRIHERWDALRTLQFVHSMTQEHFPKLPARAALQLAGWGEAAESLEAMRGRLAAAEQSLPTCIGVGSWAF